MCQPAGQLPGASCTPLQQRQPPSAPAHLSTRTQSGSVSGLAGEASAHASAAAGSRQVYTGAAPPSNWMNSEICGGRA